MYRSSFKYAVRNRRGAFLQAIGRIGRRSREQRMQSKVPLSSSKAFVNLVYDNRKRKYFNTFGEELSPAEVFFEETSSC